MADIKILGKVFNGVSKLKVQNSSGEGTTEFSAGGGNDEIFKKVIDRSITSLTNFPSGLTKIGDYAFAQCSSLESVEIPSGVLEISSFAFVKCYALSSIIIPDSVTKLGTTNTFLSCENIENFRANGNITVFGSGCFNTEGNSHPMKLKTARLPNLSFTSSFMAVFGNSQSSMACKLLELVDLGDPYTIGSYCFSNCNSLTKLIIRKTGSIVSLSNVNAFNNTPFSGYNSGTGVVYVPSALIDTYKAASNWSTLYNSGNGSLSFSALETSPYANPDFVLS